MATKTYVPSIITKKNRKIKDQKFEIAFLRAVHDDDKERIKNVVSRDVRISQELDALINGFAYGGKK